MAATQRGAITPTSQAQNIKDYLLSGKSLTALEALGLFRCFRLAARVGQLRKAGINIKTEMCRDITDKAYAKYSYEAPTPKVLTNGEKARFIRRSSAARAAVGDVVEVKGIGVNMVRIQFPTGRMATAFKDELEAI